MTRTLARSLLLSFVLLAVGVPLVALAQSVGDPAASPLNVVGVLWPKAAPYIALVTPIQLIAKLLAPLPGRVGGYTHSTIWSRFWDTVAAFPAAPASRPTK